ncbi:hypothetical protein RSAG8_12896, partial [Rhizoctonia solani AG-8 WAC10335]
MSPRRVKFLGAIHTLRAARFDGRDSSPSGVMSYLYFLHTPHRRSKLFDRMPSGARGMTSSTQRMSPE